MASAIGNRRQGNRSSTLPPVPQKKKGLVPALYRMRPDQVAALRREALRRAAAAGSGKPDMSEIVRAAIDAWLAAKGRK